MKYIIWLFFVIIVWLQFISNVVLVWKWRWYVEIATTPEQHEIGLMNRKEMHKNRWMIFIFDQARQVNFWMKNTYIPLDMIFLNESGVVEKIHYWAKPEDTTLIPGSMNTKYVLEILSWQAVEWEIHTWDTMKLQYWFTF